MQKKKHFFGSHSNRNNGKDISFFLWLWGPTPPQAPSFMRFLDHTQNDAPQSVGLLWTSDQPVAENST